MNCFGHTNTCRWPPSQGSFTPESESNWATTTNWPTCNTTTSVLIDTNWVMLPRMHISGPPSPAGKAKWCHTINPTLWLRQTSKDLSCTRFESALLPLGSEFCVCTIGDGAYPLDKMEVLIAPSVPIFLFCRAQVAPAHCRSMGLLCHKVPLSGHK